MTEKRVLHIYQSPSYSGAEAYSRDVALHHVRQNHHVVFLAKADSPLANKILQDVQSLKVGNFELETDVSKIDFKSFDAVVLHSTQELKTHWPTILKAKIQNTRNCCYTIYSHIWISHSKRDPIHYFIYKLIDQFWCSSRSSKENLERLLPIPAEKIRIVRYGRSIKDFERSLLSRQDARTRLNIPTDATVFGTLGRVDEGKGSRELFDAALALLAENSKLHFLMIGPPTASDPKAVVLNQKLDSDLDELATSNPDLRRRIHKIGRLENGSAYLTAFDLFVLATYKENFALTLLEAQLAGIPCLATNSGGSPDLVQNDRTGWLFKPASTESLTTTLREAFSQSSRWKDFGLRGQEQVRNEYEFDQVLKEIDRNLGLSNS